MREHKENEEYQEHKEHQEYREHQEHREHDECKGHKRHEEHKKCKGHRKQEAHKKFREHGGRKAHEAHSAWRKEHYAAANINDKLVINLRDLSHTMRFLYEGKGSQKRILIILDEAGGSMTQRKLTERLGIQPGSASEVIAKLESTGYIRRTPNETDRRTADIELTETGRQSAADARQQRMNRHEQMFECLSDTEKNELLSLLEKVNTDWEERYHKIEDQSMPHEHSHPHEHPDEFQYECPHPHEHSHECPHPHEHPHEHSHEHPHPHEHLQDSPHERHPGSHHPHGRMHRPEGE